MSWLLKKGREFLGQDGAASSQGGNRLVTLRFDDPAALMHSWTPVYHDDEVVGWVASGEYGYSVGAFIAHAFAKEGLTEAARNCVSDTQVATSTEKSSKVRSGTRATSG
ncbi:MAG: glycine cleavage T C-terminal barrel domain-containing protein [Acidimicrobiia bacterium]